MASSPQKNLQFISPPKEAGDFLQNQVKNLYIIFVSHIHCSNFRFFIPYNHIIDRMSDRIPPY